MPEVNGNDPVVREGDYINLLPCATPDEADPTIAHQYEARQVVQGVTIKALGWSTLAEARQTYDDQPYAVRWGSHSFCPPCFQRKSGL